MTINHFDPSELDRVEPTLDELVRDYMGAVPPIAQQPLPGDVVVNPAAAVAPEPVPVVEAQPAGAQLGEAQPDVAPINGVQSADAQVDEARAIRGFPQ